jgi:hypothetical protein
VTPADPARIHLLPAAKAPVVIVVRRKPSRLFHIIRVDTDTGKAEHGAWFTGHLYPMRSDVSFDGKWFVYLALGKFGKTWNAVSELPRLTAVAEGENRGTWYGGGYWRSRDVLCLNRWVPKERAKLPFRAEQLDVRYGGEDLSVLYPRLERDGWRRRGDSWGREHDVKGARKLTVLCEGDDGWMRQPSSKHPELIMWYAGYLKAGYTFRFRVPAQPDLLDDDVDWANYDSIGQLVVARKGVVTIHRWRRARFEAVHTLDFEALRPERRASRKLPEKATRKTARKRG